MDVKAEDRWSAADDGGHGGLQVMVAAGPARFPADQPVAQGGLDLGPTPHDLVAAGLAACTAQTLRLYARRKGIPLGAVHVAVSHHRNAEATPHDSFSRVITLAGGLDADQRARLLQIADMCPIHRLLTGGATISTTLAP